MNKLINVSIAAASVLFVAGCGTSPTTSSTYPDATTAERGVAYGTVRRVELVEPERSGPGAGAVIGGVIGGVLGNQVGKGDGRTAATVLGAAGGAYAGNEIEKSRRSANPAYQYTVQLDRGDYKTFTFASDQGYTTGQRVVLVDGVLQQRY
jgi:outer membrane lipoprotein SlyB